MKICFFSGHYECIYFSLPTNPPGLFSFPLSLLPSFLSLSFIFSPSYFFLSLHKAKAFGSVDGTLTEDMMDSGVKDMIEQHKQKVFWEKGSS